MFKNNLMFSEWFILYPSEIRYISPLLNLKRNSQPHIQGMAMYSIWFSNKNSWLLAPEREKWENFPNSYTKHNLFMWHLPYFVRPKGYIHVSNAFTWFCVIPKAVWEPGVFSSVGI